MGTIIAFLQHQEGVLQKPALVSLAVAESLKRVWKADKILSLVLGKGAQSAADASLAYGVDEALYCEGSELEKYLAEPYSQAVQAAMQMTGATVVVGTATSLVKDLFPRVAARLEAGQASDIVAVNPDGSLIRPMYAGDVMASVRIKSDRRVVSARGTAFSPAMPSQKRGSVKALEVAFEMSKAGEVVSYELSKGGRPELTDAEVVVSGGRAMQSSENFEKFIFPLADAFGGAVGASRAAVDSGYAPNDWQVGQTGKIVAPRLYIAVGISGAIQHLAGMKDSKTIVAINKDPDAPIYEIADYGLVADLYEVVPKLTEQVKAARG